MTKIYGFLSALFIAIVAFINSIPGMPVSQKNIRAQLQECLPKSDMASKETCDRLLQSITTFEDCMNAGFTVVKTDKEICQLPDGRMLIKQSSASSGGSSLTLRGSYSCLPHKDTGGPQTMECAFGMKGDNGLFYALDTSILQSTSIVDVKTGDAISVEGVFIPIEELSTNQWLKYDIKGIIRVNTLKKI